MKRHLYFVVLAALLTSCGVGKMTTTQKADALFDAGDYAGALVQYKAQLALTNGVVDTLLYRKAAIASSMVGDHAEACRLAAYIPTKGDAQLLTALANSLQKQDRIHEVAQLIEDNKSVYASAWGEDSVNVHIAKYYNSICDEKIVEVYPLLKNAAVRSECFECYFKKIKGNETPAKLKEICEAALKDDPKSVVAVRQMAIVLYEQAEDSYQSAMATYNKKKNATTYNKLLKDLKSITPIFIKSKERFEQLRTMGVAEANDLKRLVNVYRRLDQESKAKAIEKLL